MRTQILALERQGFTAHWMSFSGEVHYPKVPANNDLLLRILWIFFVVPPLLSTTRYDVELICLHSNERLAMTEQTVDQVTTLDLPGLETFTDTTLNNRLRTTGINWNIKGWDSGEAIDFAMIDIRRLKRPASSDS